MDALTMGVIWISVGIALVLLIQEQAGKLSDFARAQQRAQAAVAEEILEVCGDPESVAFYQSQADRLPDNLVYYALAETRQRLADGAPSDGPTAYFRQVIVRLASEQGCRLDAEAMA